MLVVSRIFQVVPDNYQNSEISGYNVQYGANGETFERSEYVGSPDILYLELEWVYREILMLRKC